MPSKKVYIKRAQQFIHEGIKSQAMQENLSYSKLGIGGYFKEKESVLSGHGLEDAEVKLLLPAVLGTGADSQGFMDKVDIYYRNINTVIPYGNGGREFEVGLKRSNEESISVDNMPLKLDDFLRFRHAAGKVLEDGTVIIKGHPRVALSPELVEGDLTMKFFVEDPQKVLKGKLSEQEEADKALTYYLQVKKESKKTDMIVSLMARKLKPKPGQVVYDVDKASDGEKLIALKELSEKYPKEFSVYANDPNISRKWFIDQLLKKGIIRRNGDTVVDGVTGQPMGKTLGEVMGYIYNPTNIGVLNDYKVKAAGKGIHELAEI